MNRRGSFLVAAWAMGVAASTAARAPQDETPRTAQSIDAKALFVTNCASCHGETGDGKGWTELDRPARSFRDGGFSFGNTPLALFRTISTGIPGTPMPAFASSLSEDERRALADYVVTLGPPVEEVDLERAVMTVGETPLVVRGYLPPVAEGARELPRGILVGLPSGLTFEYRADDVRLLAVRQGGFVERMDWTGRGGNQLNPLGKVVHLVEGGQPRAGFSVAGVGSLRAALAGTWVVGADAGISYRLLDEDGTSHAVVRESARALGNEFGSGFVRRFEIAGPGHDVELRLRAPFRSPEHAGGGVMFEARQLEGGVHELVTVHAEGRPLTFSRGQDGRAELVLPLVAGETHVVEIAILSASTWSAEVRARLLEEVLR